MEQIEEEEKEKKQKEKEEQENHAQLFKTLIKEVLREINDKKDPNTPNTCLLYTSPSPRDRQKSRMPSSA